MLDRAEELKYKYILVELYGANSLPLFVTVLQVVNVDLFDMICLADVYLVLIKVYDGNFIVGFFCCLL